MRAEIHLGILEEVVEDEMATKADIQNLGSTTKMEMQRLASATKDDIQNLASATKADIQNLASTTQADIQGVRSELKQLELRMTIKLGLMQAATVGLMAAILKLF